MQLSTREDLNARRTFLGPRLRHALSLVPEVRPAVRLEIFADTHGHLTNIRLAVERFNADGVELVLLPGSRVHHRRAPTEKAQSAGGGLLRR